MITGVSKIDLKANKIKRNPEIHFTFFQRVNIAGKIIDVYVSNNRAPKYMEQKLIKFQAKTEKSTVIVVISISIFQ